jgi:hypothetical protein
MFQTIAQQTALVLAGSAIGWIALFSFVLAPTVFGMDFERSRGERVVKSVMKSGHGILAVLILFSAVAALFSGAVAAAAVGGVAAIFAISCKWALAPRKDRPIRGRRVIKTARIVASGLTAAIMPVLLAQIFLTHAGI